MTPEVRARRHVRDMLGHVVRRGNELRATGGSIHRTLLEGARRRYLESLDAKALQFQRIHGSSRHGRFTPQPFHRAAELARRLDLSGPYTNPVMYEEIRLGRSGKLRRIFDLPPALRVSHRMATALIGAQFEPQPHIYSWKRRGSARMLHDMTAAFDMGYGALLLADVNSCYDSINFDAVYGLDLLPSEFVAAQLDMRRMNLVRSACEHLAGETIGGAMAVCPLCLSKMEREPVDQSQCEINLVQGSPVSNSVLAVLFDDLARHLPDGILAFVYSDNIALLARGEDELSAARDALVSYYSHHAAGRLSLKFLFMDDPRNGFEHLGYRVEWREGGWSIGLSDANFERQMARIVARHSKPPRLRQSYEDRFAMTRQDALTSLHEFTAGFPAITADRKGEVFEFLLNEEFNSAEDFPVVPAPRR